MLRKRIVCLANSKKYQGRCVAGREIIRGKPGPWIRPISSREYQELRSYERCYADGSEPCLLDVLDLPLLEPRPKDYQTENWLLDPERCPEKVGELPMIYLERFLEGANGLWESGFSSSFGENDRIPTAEAIKASTSLILIRVGGLRLRVASAPPEAGGERRFVRAHFTFEDEHFALRVTDPIIIDRYRARDEGDYPVGECFLTISLGEPYRGFCYKLVAAVMMKE